VKSPNGVSCDGQVPRYTTSSIMILDCRQIAKALTERYSSCVRQRTLLQGLPCRSKTQHSEAARAYCN